MKTDMSGSAIVLGVFLGAAASSRSRCGCTACSPSPRTALAAAPTTGRRHPHHGGRTVEIGNTDAEGRLVMADALAYAAPKLDPTGWSTSRP